MRTVITSLNKPFPIAIKKKREIKTKERRRVCSSGYKKT